jgi:hypothetical protein
MLYKDEQKALAKVSALFKEGKFADIKEGKEKRSIPQNDLYWFWLTFLEKESETGYTKNEFHEFFKFHILYEILETLVFKNGNTWQYFKRQSTTELNTKQFAEYMEKVERFANTELNVTLPHPEDLGFAELFEKYGN